MKFKKIPSYQEYEEYIEDRGTNMSSFLSSAYKKIAEYFKERDFNKQNFREMVKAMLDSGQYKKVTIKKYINVGRSLTHILDEHYLDDYKGFRNDEEAIPLGEFISDYEMAKLSSCNLFRNNTSKERIDEINLKFNTAFTLMRFSGIPPVDLCHLKWNQDKGTHFDFKRSKTGKAMVIPIVEQLRTLLDQLPRLPHGYIFGSEQGRMKQQTLNSELKKRCIYLNIKKKVTCYSFRHSFITLTYIEGGESMLPKLSKITGHDMNTAVKHYARFNIDVLTDALYATHPGLKKTQDIDSIKRILMNLLQKLIDTSQFEITLNIRPKDKDNRTITLS